MAQISTQAVYNSPIAVDHRSLQERGFQPRNVFGRYEHHVPESQHYIVGPMPPQQFLDEFLPDTSTDRGGMRSSKHAFRGVPTHATTHTEVCVPLVRCACERVINMVSNLYAPGCRSQSNYKTQVSCAWFRIPAPSFTA